MKVKVKVKLQKKFKSVSQGFVNEMDPRMNVGRAYVTQNVTSQ